MNQHAVAARSPPMIIKAAYAVRSQKCRFFFKADVLWHWQQISSPRNRELRLTSE
jgi:hypothetical protein